MCLRLYDAEEALSSHTRSNHLKDTPEFVVCLSGTCFTVILYIALVFKFICIVLFTMQIVAKWLYRKCSTLFSSILSVVTL